MKKAYQWLAGLGLASFTCVVGADTVNLVLDAKDTGVAIQPTMYGVFFEDINFAADGGLYAELVKNRSFEFEQPLMGWNQPQTRRLETNTNTGEAVIMSRGSQATNQRFAHITVNDPNNYSLTNEGFRGIGVHKNATYIFSVMAANIEQKIEKIHVQLVGEKNQVLGETFIAPKELNWHNYQAKFRVNDTEEKAKLKLTFEGKGAIDIDMVSLFPEDTWKQRPGGLRKDIAQLIADLKPGFIRFPGGCIVEGRTLAQRYQWKKTVGNVSDRETSINRWNMEFKHRPAPDYYQSFGLGFFEYFQFAEDVGASPLPILSCGIACQFNSGELAQMNQLDAYVQDALDLIEFANGDTTTPWGKVRADLGHPKPFNLSMIGIGNEQWGPQYIERFKVFQNVLKEKHPEIRLVSGSGPMPDGDQFDYAHRELKQLNAEIIDEHYYKESDWFLKNATRYDSYDRQGPKIFAGEYAAQSKSVGNQENKNTWGTALAEAAFMTGLERNADVVYMTSYAPLMAHAEAWQWAPDMIWFNNLQAYGTANYYVQKLYSNNKGTDLLRLTLDGKPVTGQQKIYATAAKNRTKNELIVKLVNAGGVSTTVNVALNGVSVSASAMVSTLTSSNLTDENTFAQPQAIAPVTSKLKLDKNQLNVEMKPQSFSVVVMKLQ